MWVQNLCSHPVTVKFAKSGGDIRKDIPAGERIEEDMPLGSKAWCCPRYNSCEDHAPGKPPNLARGKPATQSSDYLGAVAARAVDGNSDGNYQAGSVTHTNSTAQPWWQVDLGAAQGLREVVLYNRTDAGPERLSNFEIKVSSDGATWTKVAELAGTAPPGSAYQMNVTGRYVRVQLRGTNPLSLAEVEVYGPQNLSERKPATCRNQGFLGDGCLALDRGRMERDWPREKGPQLARSARVSRSASLCSFSALRSLLFGRVSCVRNEIRPLPS